MRAMPDIWHSPREAEQARWWEHMVMPLSGTRHTLGHGARLGRSEGFRHDRTNPYVTDTPEAKTRAETRLTAGVRRFDGIRPRDRIANATCESTMCQNLRVR